MHGYSSDYAEFYDNHVVPEDRGDVPFYRTRARTANGPVLELACGTGRVHLPLLEDGVDADGLDLSASALRRLYEKAAARGLTDRVSAWQASMSALPTVREYALVVCPFDGFLHLLTTEAQLHVLRSVYEILSDGGAFVFDVFVPDFDHIERVYGEWDSRTAEFRGRPHTVRTRTAVENKVEQVFINEIEVIDDGDGRRFDQALRLKMLPPREIELLARLSPFDEWEATGEFEARDLRPDDDVQTWTLRKRP